MDQGLKNLLETMNIYFTEAEEQQYFDEAKIVEKIFFKSKNEVRIYIFVKDFLPTHILHKLEFGLASETTHMKAKLNLIVGNKAYNHELIWRHIEYVKDNKAEVKTGTILSLSPTTVLYDEAKKEVSFVTESLTEKNLLLQHTQYYQAKLTKYGFEDIVIKIKINENRNDDSLLKANQNLAELSQRVVVSTSQDTKPSTLTPQKVNYKTKLDLGKPDYAKLADLEENAMNVTVHGQVISVDIKNSKAARKIYSLGITDSTSSVKAIYFQRGTEVTLFDDITHETKDFFDNPNNQKVEVGDWVALNGNFTHSSYDKEHVFYITKYQKIESKNVMRQDDALEKRVELHTHTKMSAMDGVSEAKEYIKAAKSWGWKALAITDHLNVQTFPDAFYALESVNKNCAPEDKLKLIYGTELVVLDDDYWIVKNAKGQDLRSAKFVIFDLETTGLSPEFDEIIEFGANIYDYSTGKSESQDILIKPSQPVSEFTTELTHITNEMLEDKNSIEVEFKRIYEIIEGAILIAHNANFDFNFLNVMAQKLNYPPLQNTVIDTLTLARAILPKLKNHRLGTVAKNYNIEYDEKDAHRADYDAEVLTSIFERMWSEARLLQTVDLDTDWNKFISDDKLTDQNHIRVRGYHLQVLAKNQAGLKDLYKVISFSHTKNFINSPKIFRSELLRLNANKNLLIGSGCLNGEVFENVRTGTLEMLRATIKLLDYVEVQPVSVYKKLLQTGDLTVSQVQSAIKTIIKIAKEEQVLVVATSDAHYVEPEAKTIRDIYINTKGLGGVSHPLFDYKRRVKDNPDQHLRTTKEMLEEFKFLEDSELIHEIVITNPQKIAALVEPDLQPLKKELYTPKIDNVDKLLRDECYSNARKMYGQTLPELVESRLEKELTSIIKHGFAVIYWISHLLVKKSYDDGYLVGSRGSVGSSFAATTAKITEVNPLRPHYRCLQCQYSDFNTPEEYKCGFDLPDQTCPQCQALLIGDGHDIPFETFLGFDGDKVPDIDLNFSGEYQPIAHNFTKEMFGENNVFRSGTISTVADKTAFGYTMGYFEAKGVYDVRRIEVERLAKLTSGVKRTTGQHPGGIIILPKEYEIEDFTPVNYPADDSNSSWLTTHFDFHSIHDNLLKMDILGHVDPTALRMLQDLTGVDPQKIPVNDKKVYALFSNLTSLDLTPDKILGETTGAIGLPEFGTSFVRNMLKETQPKSFADLVQISGLSHGTDVYVGNAQDLIQAQVADISSVIGCRDDIMVYLMAKGIDPSTSFNIMESVRKGKGLSNEWIAIMKQNNVQEWYINSCLKIKYMFPKAHATAYVLMAYRVAWYKIYYPEEYYATWFTTRSDHFDLQAVIGGELAVKSQYDLTEQKLRNKEPVSSKEKALQPIYEVMLEMFARNISIKNIDINISDAAKFIVREENQKKVIYPPFNVIDSLGEAVANSIVVARTESPITSIKDLTTRSQVTKTQLETFKKLKILNNLKEDEQLSFDF